MRDARLSSASPAQILPASAFGTVRDTLHLVYHHNKNQHQSTKWFKWLGILRRQTHKLIVELQAAEHHGHLDLTFDDHEAKSIRDAMIHLDRDIVPRCYGAFSSVILDKQFSAMGMVLLAALAEISGLINKSGLDYASCHPSLKSEAFHTVHDTGVATLQHGHRSQEDIGELVGRSEISESLPPRKRGGEVNETEPHISVKGPGPQANKGRKRGLGQEDRETRGTLMQESPGGENPQAPDKVEVENHSSKLRKKKRRKKGNAIDDIFGDLG
ncbi:predicted protein [Uncinocarpus reesii 1704]|uniref:RNase MRP protein 1 RNA binding domain-containing protein n=1 Tax=Uncinocarpus reesii (strain UAMH 1704) TaxID=336963 RepID=C4JPJ2_UNCRE|nr:uncharacterized protein UREG_03164 [Uncinocarpus reesii 1704]EEP78318.1 predicted protein [Uncinocarpus reesii 1704]